MFEFQKYTPNAYSKVGYTCVETSRIISFKVGFVRPELKGCESCRLNFTGSLKNIYRIKTSNNNNNNNNMPAIKIAVPMENHVLKV
jgi:hypothetical protein